MRIARSTWVAIGLVVISGLAAVAFSSREHWLGWLPGQRSLESVEEEHLPAPGEPKLLKLSDQARKNLSLVSRPFKAQTYSRTIQVPGVIIDRPGVSDRGITAPAVGAVGQVYAFPGDTVKPGDRLFTLRLNSEYLQNTQSELFKTTREAQLVKEQRERLEGPVKSGAIPETKLIEVDNQLRRLTAVVQSHRQDLLTRGLSPAQIDSVAAGKFVSEIVVVAPSPLDVKLQGGGESPAVESAMASRSALAYEVQELKVDLGQQVQAGQLLCVLANHRSLYIEGHSFKREASFLEQAAQNSWPIRVEFAEEESQGWPALDQVFAIRHLANAVDPATRTFAFYVPLINQSRQYEKDGRTFMVWRFRPGAQVRLHVTVEEFKGVIVLPAAAVVREGPDAYVFSQDGDLFERRPVTVLYEDRLNAVLANDGSIATGTYLAQSAAASLNRVLKAQAASGGLPAGAHFHADGSLHVPGK